MMKYVSTRLVPLTPELAFETATMPEFRGERPLRKSQVAFLRSKYASGVFYSPRWSYVTMNGTRYRINGQHSATMLVELDGEFPKGLSVIVDEFVANETSELAELFSQFDATKSVRSRGQVVTAHGRVHRDLDIATPTMLSACVRGIVFGKTDGITRLVSADDSARLLHVEKDFVVWASEFVRTKWIGPRASVVGAMYRTYHRSRVTATPFWEQVRDQSHPRNDHPTRVLAEFLRENITGGKLANPWEPRAFYVKCLHAWNALRSGKNTSLLYHKTTGIPKVR